MKKHSKKSRSAHSIRVQMAFVFIAVLIATVGISFLINSIFLQDYYVKKKISTLEKACNGINSIVTVYGSDSYELEEECNRLVNNSSMSIVVANSSFDTVYSSENRSDMMISRLVWHFFSNDDDRAPLRDDGGSTGGAEPPENKEKKIPPSRILKQTEKYSIARSNDAMFSTDYIELWGILDAGDIIFMRTPVESIKESVSISNRFILYIMFVMSLVGVILMWFLSKRITKPILELTDVADRMAHMDFDARYEGRGKNEVDELGDHINDMSMKLERAMSELKTANNELRRDIEKKEKMENMRSEFISNVSHELKTPIALIQGYAEGLKDNVNTDEESRDFYCDVIMDEADRMNRLVKNLLTLNKHELGSEEVKLERFDITELIKNCIVSSDIILKQYSVTAAFNEEGPVYVWGDEFKVEEVFTNFFSNAIHYAGGEKKIDVKCSRHDNKTRISVFNTGSPIPEDSLEHLWEKFYKVDKARSREVGGSGVGLSIVKAIMDALNNSYGVVNYENGVEFYFELDSADGMEE
ncbi:MAG: HAMP domain-containing protein [Lachnospiraceae bacterium]|nr:HAMP domain-containing protein [Lachnospiraceae bacterium]